MSNGSRPDRGSGSGEPPANALPADLAYQLIHVAGRPEHEVAGMTLQRATEIMLANRSRRAT